MGGEKEKGEGNMREQGGPDKEWTEREREPGKRFFD